MFIYYELNCVNDFLELLNNSNPGMESFDNKTKPEMSAKFSVLINKLCPIKSVDEFIEKID